ELRVLGQPQEIEVSAGRKRPVYTVLVKSGSVDVEVPKGSESAVALSAPRKLTVLVRSGRAGLRAIKGQVSLANVDGDILVGHDTRHFKALRPGMIHHFAAHGVVEDSLLEPPTELAGPRVLISTGEPVALERLWWRSRAGAEGYRVELQREGERGALLRVETREPILPRQSLRLEPGRYRIAVRALDEFGFESKAALESSVHVVKARLPQGAYVDAAGKIRLLPGSMVEFLHLEGLELSYADFAHERAPAKVGLTGAEPVKLLLRAGRQDPLLLNIAPRTVRARVAISPARATWPGDTLTIDIALEDPSGQPVPDSIEIRPKVLLGVEPITLEFKRVGRKLRAVVPAQPGPGPWVVRVEVNDQYGLPLGRGSLEIAKSPR
ncbi:MAG TPA: hypothetical protein VM686_13665, partial [Polyangiaceae bacterium]|nr:hypothetical protein [Polyangiaceae bacterium]